jgi:hypothetical protein
MIQTYYQSLVWFKHTISHWYDSDILSNHANDWYYVWIIPVTDSMSESYQWLILCLNHTNDWYYVWIIPMTDNMSHIISHWYDSDIISVIGMMQVYYQSLAWFRHIISYWHDSDIISVIGMIQTQWLIICLNHTYDWYYVWIIPITDDIPESCQWLIIYLNHTIDS